MTRKTRDTQARSTESRLGRRFAKKYPSKLLSAMLWVDWPHYGPTGAAKLRKWVKAARRKELQEVLRIERINEE